MPIEGNVLCVYLIQDQRLLKAQVPSRTSKRDKYMLIDLPAPIDSWKLSISTLGSCKYLRIQRRQRRRRGNMLNEKPIMEETEDFLYATERDFAGS